jgi:hypothetical protein
MRSEMFIEEIYPELAVVQMDRFPVRGIHNKNCDRDSTIILEMG